MVVQRAGKISVHGELQVPTRQSPKHTSLNSQLTHSAPEVSTKLNNPLILCSMLTLLLLLVFPSIFLVSVLFSLPVPGFLDGEQYRSRAGPTALCRKKKKYLLISAAAEATS